MRGALVTCGRRRCAGRWRRVRGNRLGLLRSSDFDAKASAPFLHVRSPDLHIESTGLEERFPERLQVFRTEIVQIGREQDDFPRLDRLGGEYQSQGVGVIAWVPTSGSPRPCRKCTPACRRSSG